MQNRTSLKNITDLRNSLLDNYASMKCGRMELGTGKCLRDTAIAIMQSAKVELGYNQYMGVEELIPFLVGSKTENNTPEVPTISL